LSRKQALARKAVSWFAVALGTLPGFYGLVMLCQEWVPEDHVRPDWLALLLEAVGLGILAMVFFIASFAAIRNRRCSGLSFLFSAPVVAFCLSFEDGYFGAPFRGYDWNRPSLLLAALFVCAFFAPLYVPLMPIRNRIRALCLFLALALLSGLLFRLSPWSRVILPRLVEFSAPFLILGAFWAGTDKLGWPPLVATWRRSRRRQLAMIVAGCALVAMLVFLGTLVVSARGSYAWGRDCGERDLFAHPLSSDHAVFTAQAIRVGHVTKVSGRWAGNWAIGLVQERFWGLPWWSPRLVFLTTHAFWEGETYLIDGRRDPRLLNRFLPIVEAGPCTYTGPVDDASVELHLLREAPSLREVRIVGHVEDHLHPKELRVETMPVLDWSRMSESEIQAVEEHRRYSFVSYRRQEAYLPGARIRVKGSSGSVNVTADRDGFYEVAGLPPDDYSLELLDIPGTQSAVNGAVKKKELLGKKLVWKDLYLFWDGAIQGRIRDLSGEPAELGLHIERADGVIEAESSKNSWTNDKGAFSFPLLPPGRYIMRINEDGPRAEAPYAPQYYPSSAGPEGAHVFEVGEGRHIRNVDFVLRRLDERNLRVRVGWPDGRPADGASVRIAYEHTDLYDRGGRYGTDVDQNGIGDITLFSGSHIRVWAERLVDEKLRRPSLRYSGAVELETDKLPPRLNLVVMSTKPPFH
jgi:hypothetical protein